MIDRVLRTLGKYYLKRDGNVRIERIWKLAQVEFKKRYYNDKLGLLWSVLNPAFQIAVFYFVFKYIRPGDKEDNFVLFLYIGLITYNTYHALGLKGLNILNSKKYLLENITFNKIDIFWATSFSALLSFVIDLCVYAFIAFFLGAKFDFYAFYIFIIIFQVLSLGVGVAMILSIIKIFIHDIKIIWRLCSFALFWSSGIFFSGKLILTELPWFILVNPLVGILINVRSIFLYGEEINLYYCMINSIQCCSILLVGILLFVNYWQYSLEKLQS